MVPDVKHAAPYSERAREILAEYFADTDEMFRQLGITLEHPERYKDNMVKLVASALAAERARALEEAALTIEAVTPTTRNPDQHFTAVQSTCHLLAESIRKLASARTDCSQEEPRNEP